MWIALPSNVKCCQSAVDLDPSKPADDRHYLDFKQSTVPEPLHIFPNQQRPGFIQ